MKKIRLILLISVITLLLTLSMLYCEIINGDDLIKGALLGAFISIAVYLPIDYLSFVEENKTRINNYFWKGVIPYYESLDEIFLYSQKIYDLEKDVFEKKYIERKSGSWEVYKNVYLDNKELLEPIINRFENEIISTSTKHSNTIPYLSSLLSNIERKSLLGANKKEYDICYKAYTIIEDIDWTLREAKKCIDDVSMIDNDIERKCSLLIVFRWMGYTYVENYDRNIEDISSEEKTDTSVTKTIAKKDLDIAVQKIAEIV